MAKSDDRVVLADDEVVTVFLGADQPVVKEFGLHPFVHWIPAEAGNDITEILNKVPPKTRVFLLTDQIPPPIYTRLTDVARKSGQLYIQRSGERAVRKLLFDFFPKQKSAREGGIPFDKGKVKRFLEANPPDLQKGSADEARRLIEIARVQGVATTFGSLSQAIANLKRKAQTGDIPKSVRTDEDNAVQTLDELIDTLTNGAAAMQLLRDFITKTALENIQLKDAVSTVQKLLSSSLGLCLGVLLV